MLTTYLGYKHIEVPCVSFTKDAGRQALTAAGLTWHVNDIDSLDPRGVEVLMDQIQNGKTSPKILESLKCSFVFRDISRVCLARLTRDQCEGINSESQATPSFDKDMRLSDMHVDRNVTMPLNIALNDEFREEFISILERTEAFQKKLEDANFAWAPDIRYIGPMGTQISIFMQFNARQFVAACNRRFINSINDEDNYAYRKARRSLRRSLETAVAAREVDVLTAQLWSKVIDDCEPRRDYTDVLFGKQFDRGVPFVGDSDTHIYNRDQAAWAYELIRMKFEEPELLLTGEEAMIDRWINEPSKLRDYAQSLKEGLNS